MRGIEGTHELSCNAPRRGKRNEVQEAVQAENKEDHARQISGDCGSGSHYRVLLLDWQPFHDGKHIDLNPIDDVYFSGIQLFYEPRLSRGRPCLVSNDEGDARPDEVCSCW